uniref:4-nitrophenylphosphatase n=1 Tax=Anopheles atroparvus TaxID=41427 RepID=A0AAG5DII4_ANOAO
MAKVTKNLSQLSIEAKEQFLDSFDMVQTDCDGVLWMLKDPYEGVAESIKELRNNGKKLVFVSNNSVRTMDDYRAKLEKVTDYTVEEEDIVHPAKVVIAYLKERGFDSLCYVIGSKHFKKCLRDAGIQVLDGPNEPVNESVAEIVPVIADKKPVGAVIVDFDYNCNNIKLLRAQLYLQHRDCWFIAGAMDKVLPVGPKMRLLGPGYYVEMLQDITDMKPIVLGKPGLAMSKVLKRKYAIENPQRVLFIGDQPEMDVKFGGISNFQTLLVGTGGVQEGDLQKYVSLNDPYLVPDYYIGAFADLAQIVRDVAFYKTTKANKL